MKLRVFTLRLEEATGRFDDAEVVDFLTEREALSMSEHFFVHERVPTLVILVQYRETVRVPRTPRKAETERGPGGARRPPPLDLPIEHQPLFDELRKWRNHRSKREGKPPYVLFTNAQLGAIATTRPQTKSELEAIEGVGPSRVRDYAEEVLALVSEMPAQIEEATDVSTD